MDRGLDPHKNLFNNPACLSKNKSYKTPFCIIYCCKIKWYVLQAICGMIRVIAEPIFAEYIGKFQCEAIDFETLSLGTLPPTIHGNYLKPILNTL